MEYEGKVMISELQNYFKFEQLSGNEESLNRWVIVPDVNRPGLELAGFYKHTEPRRIVIIGDKEQAYIDTLSVEIQRERFEQLTDGYTPTIILTHHRECPPVLLEVAGYKNFPIFRTAMTTSRLMVDLISFLDERLAPSDSIHGVLISVYGKGVLICNTLEEAQEGVKSLMLDHQFGAAGNTIVIEEFMTGREVSVLSFVDGNTIKTMTSAQDHKRAKDGDQGLNTGGMGTFSPSPFYTKEVDAFCKAHIYQATVDAMKAEGRPFKGIIFFGLMLTEEGPKVLEYNARFGDPEAQVVLPRMKNDIIDVMEACVDGKLDTIDLQFEDNAAVCVVLASDGYPVSYEKGFPITGLEKFDGKDDYFCFHAGTKFDENGTIVTNGGRVLGITATGKDLKEARAKAYEATEWVDFANKYMRHDIGRAIDEVK